MNPDAIEYGIQKPGGPVLDPTTSLTEAQGRLTRYQDPWPDATLVSRPVFYGNWRPVTSTGPDRLEQAPDDLQALYKRLCDMHMDTLLVHGPQVAQGLALAIKEVHALLPDAGESSNVSERA